MPDLHIVKRLPQLISQDSENCWAAALASWLDCTPGRKKLSMDQLVGRYATNLDDASITPQDLAALLADRLPAGGDKQNVPVGMFIENFSGVRLGDLGTGLQIINWCYLATLLVAKGPLFMAWKYSKSEYSSWWHCVILYRMEGYQSGPFAPLYNPQNPNPCGGPYYGPFADQDHPFGLYQLGELPDYTEINSVMVMDPHRGYMEYVVQPGSTYESFPMDYSSPIWIGYRTW
jgi:hypothetical protein